MCEKFFLIFLLLPVPAFAMGNGRERGCKYPYDCHFSESEVLGRILIQSGGKALSVIADTDIGTDPFLQEVNQEGIWRDGDATGECTRRREMFCVPGDEEKRTEKIVVDKVCFSARHANNLSLMFIMACRLAESYHNSNQHHLEVELWEKWNAYLNKFLVDESLDEGASYVENVDHFLLSSKKCNGPCRCLWFCSLFCNFSCCR